MTERHRERERKSERERERERERESERERERESEKTEECEERAAVCKKNTKPNRRMWGIMNNDLKKRKICRSDLRKQRIKFP